MTALLFEALDTGAALADAILAWIVAAAVVATVVLFTAVLTGAWAWRAARRGLAGAWRAEQPAPGPESIPTPQRRTGPSWALDDKEAA
ncbi:hypothetical protein [Streptomyces sp. NPDC086182]|uniref:hypothetical protein n=1 Tax=Streptomyces sp. NPDC086182 TaxID=3155058 RepID=UPI003426E08A